MEENKSPEEEKKPFSLFKPKDRKGKPGRPPKADLEAVRNRTKGKVGRPAGDAARIQEFKERLLATGGTKIIDKMIAIALNDEHPGQAAMIKLAMDRLLPSSLFDAAKAGGGTPQVVVNITGLTDAKVLPGSDEDVIDV
jgi:hypothetical protein